jgi:hypothetical protein
MQATVANDALAAAMTTTTTAVPAGGELWAMLGRARELRSRWGHSHDEQDRLAMRAPWDVHITYPGDGPLGQPPRPGVWERCTPTVLCHETGESDNHLACREHAWTAG